MQKAEGSLPSSGMLAAYPIRIIIDGELPHAPSSINPDIPIRTPEGRKDSVEPRAMTIEDIRQTISDFKMAAIRALDAGFDGVEIHSSNGYLFHQFFSNTTNMRTDEYGGFH